MTVKDEGSHGLPEIHLSFQKWNPPEMGKSVLQSSMKIELIVTDKNHGALHANTGYEVTVTCPGN